MTTEEQAKELLVATDYTQLTDVALQNKAEFTKYRGILRGIIQAYSATGQHMDESNIPVQPEPVWAFLEE
jgi:hypothetical protein|tara:strand:- start:70 stop:279 length:210 start_codon:yes stop_codon:yes gene_type:complete